MLSSLTNEETEEQSNTASRHCVLSPDAKLSLRYQVKADKTQNQLNLRSISG